MGEQILKVSNDYWSIRGDFKIGGIVNIGTHASLIRRTNGKFLMLDTYTLQGEVEEQVDALSNNGTNLEAIINLHPFHTMHVRKSHEKFPNAKLYGTRRHHDKFPDLPWQPEFSESSECAALFADDLEFSVPEGVDFISSNEHLHFSSVLAYHKASRTIHADDTLMYLQLPGLLGKIKRTEITFHITLAMTLEKRPGAVKEFQAWAEQLAEKWSDAENLCAAHSATLLGSNNQYLSIPKQILAALKKVKKTLQMHEKKFG